MHSFILSISKSGSMFFKAYDIPSESGPGIVAIKPCGFWNISMEKRNHLTGVLTTAGTM